MTIKFEKATFIRTKKYIIQKALMLIKYQSLLKEAYGTKNSSKYFIRYNDNDVMRPLCLKLPQMTGSARKLDKNTTMSFKVSNNQLLKKNNKIWRKKFEKFNEDII